MHFTQEVRISMRRGRPTSSLRIRRYIDLFQQNFPTSYGVRFGDRWTGIDFRYSWEIVIAKN